MRLPNLERKVSGFTLVEMAIVLVIIGIILAGVMKGRDIVRGAQVKQFSQQFAQKWGTVAQTYYDKTGQQLNDGDRNGGAAGAPNGLMDGAAGTRALTAATGTDAQAIIPALRAVGITPCTIIKSKLVERVTGPVVGDPEAAQCGAADRGTIFQTQVEGEYAGSQTVTVDLVGTEIVVGTGTNAQTYQRNVVALYNVPQDVARGLDTAIDGREEGTGGSCLNLGAANGAGADEGYTAAVDGGAAISELAATWNSKVWGESNDSDLQCTTVGIILDY